MTEDVQRRHASDSNSYHNPGSFPLDDVTSGNLNDGVAQVEGAQKQPLEVFVPQKRAFLQKGVQISSE